MSSLIQEAPDFGPVATADIDLTEVYGVFQNRINDASGDHHYVGKSVANLPYTAGFSCGTPDENGRRLGMLSYVIGQISAMWRANGGVGAAHVRVRWGDEGHTKIEAEVAAITKAADLFDFVRGWGAS